MWWIIIIGILGYVIYKFISDNEKLKQSLDKSGGMQEKYAVLLSYLMSSPSSKITQLSRDSIDVQTNTDYFQHYFSLLHAFDNNVIITWKASGALGQFQEKWQFPANMDQRQMAEKIDHDTQFKIRNFGDYQGLMGRINNALDDLDE